MMKATLPAIYNFAPTLVIGLFFSKLIGQDTTYYLVIGSKRHLFIGQLTQLSILFTLEAWSRLWPRTTCQSSLASNFLDG